MSTVKCAACGNEQPAYQSQGKYLWLFEWEGGGGNDVWAATIEEAYHLASKDTKLKPRLSSFRMCTYQQWADRDRAFQMMCI